MIDVQGFRGIHTELHRITVANSVGLGFRAFETSLTIQKTGLLEGSWVDASRGLLQGWDFTSGPKP